MSSEYRPELMQGPYRPGCYLCGRRDPRGSAQLRVELGRPGAPVAVCAAGQGCKDERVVRHGPPIPEHPAGQPCGHCEREAAARAAGPAPVARHRPAGARPTCSRRNAR